MKILKYPQILFLGVIFALGLSHSAVGGETGNGGGGILRDGRVLTFGSASIELPQNDAQISEIPGMKMLTKMLVRLNIPKRQQMKLLMAILPSIERKYFRLPKDSLSERQEAELKKIYGDMTGVDYSSIALFAVTDFSKKETYLLPEFFELEKEEEQAAILWHEAAWVLGAWSFNLTSGNRFSYEFVLQAEMNMQNYLEEPDVGENLRHMMKDISIILNNKLLYLSTLAQIDLEKGSFGDLIDSEQSIPIDKIFPDTADWNQSSSGYLHLLKLSADYPQSLFLDHLVENTDVFHYRSYARICFENTFRSSTRCEPDSIQDIPNRNRTELFTSNCFIRPQEIFKFESTQPWTRHRPPIYKTPIPSFSRYTVLHMQVVLRIPDQQKERRRRGRKTKLFKLETVKRIVIRSGHLNETDIQPTAQELSFLDQNFLGSKVAYKTSQWTLENIEKIEIPGCRIRKRLADTSVSSFKVYSTGNDTDYVEIKKVDQ